MSISVIYISSLHRTTPREFSVLWTENCTAALSTNLTVLAKSQPGFLRNIGQESNHLATFWCFSGSRPLHGNPSVLQKGEIRLLRGRFSSVPFIIKNLGQLLLHLNFSFSESVSVSVSVSFRLLFWVLKNMFYSHISFNVSLHFVSTHHRVQRGDVDNKQADNPQAHTRALRTTYSGCTQKKPSLIHSGCLPIQD